jgi:RNA polymerase-binding transcription factor DksA
MAKKAEVKSKSSTTKKATTKKAAPAKAVVKKKAASKKVKGYSKKELNEFKKVILAKRDEIIEQLQNLKDQMMDSSTGQYVNENSPYSLHMAEQGTDSQEREKLYLWAQRESKFLAYLEDALKRIELGTYGICIECMDEPKNLCPTCPLIPKPRLLAVPHTQHCVEIKNAAAKN